jgi:Tfp pilus assembly protein PilF
MSNTIFVMIMILLMGCASVTGDGYRGDDPSDMNHEQTRAEQALAMNYKGLELMDKGDLTQAEEVFKQGLEWDMECGPIHNNLGVLYFNQSDFYHAALEFQCAVKLMPKNAMAANNMGLVYEKAAQWDKAVEWYKTAVNLWPDSPEIMGNLARAQIKRGDKDQDLLQMLERLAVEDQRSDWSSWARDQAALMCIDEQ